MTLRIALLGVEHYHADFWARAFLQSHGVAIAGVWDLDPELAARFAERHSLGLWEDGEALAAACDAVAICSATADHLHVVGIAARHGKPILCEKPLGVSAADCAAIAEVVARSGIPFMQSFPKRFDPVNHEIAGLLSRNMLGRVGMCRIRHGHDHGFDPAFRKAWFTDPARSGGGTLLDEGIHAADFLRFLFGEPDSVSAATSSSTLGLEVEDTALAVFQYRDGMIAEVATGWCFAAADTSIEIYGTEGTILLAGVDLASRPSRESGFLRIFTRETGWKESPTVPHFKTGIFHEHLAWAFIAALKSGGPMPVTLEDGRRAFAMIEAAYRSTRTGKVQSIGFG
jgi:myo-inositol 2-dehydrogenase/D-chiro-inositol 1-dehydrogenase